MNKQEIVANYAAQLKTQGYDDDAAQTEATRLYESMYGKEVVAAAVEAAPVVEAAPEVAPEPVKPAKAKRTNKPIKGDA